LLATVLIHYFIHLLLWKP